MLLVLVILACFSGIGKAFNFDYEPSDSKVYQIKHITEEEESLAIEMTTDVPLVSGMTPGPNMPEQITPDAPELVVPEVVIPNQPSPEAVVPKVEDKPTTKDEATKNSMCDDFIRYSTKCTVSAARLYNSTRKTPPEPRKVHDWCGAIRQLTNCANQWNAECSDLNDNRFDDDSIRGHQHVLDNFCDDEWFISQYRGLSQCLFDTSDSWEHCYLVFKKVVDDCKNSSRELTHYETHFKLCCARTSFRRCTLDMLFESKSCIHEEVLIIQKFSSIISEGDVFQNCDFNMVYANCTGGDPRPNTQLLTKLVAPEESAANLQRATLALILSMLVLSLCQTNVK